MTRNPMDRAASACSTCAIIGLMTCYLLLLGCQKKPSQDRPSESEATGRVHVVLREHDDLNSPSVEYITIMETNSDSYYLVLDPHCEFIGIRVNPATNSLVMEMGAEYRARGRIVLDDNDVGSLLHSNVRVGSTRKAIKVSRLELLSANAEPEKAADRQ